MIVLVREDPVEPSVQQRSVGFRKYIHKLITVGRLDATIPMVNHPILGMFI